ncbi:hypothetical protein HY495_02085 [Candidatus Woesearchaeota archaeon]|nr:hypothetical protein [Candidatus Woesearchaeota archaeon]
MAVDPKDEKKEKGLIMEAEGINGQKLMLFEKKIRIHRKGFNQFVLHGLKGDKEIFLKSITSIQLKKAGRLTSGYIQFDFMGGQQALSGIFQGAMNENTVMFRKSQQDDFERIKELIEERIHKE